MRCVKDKEGSKRALGYAFAASVCDYYDSQTGDVGYPRLVESLLADLEDASTEDPKLFLLLAKAAHEIVHPIDSAAANWWMHRQVSRLLHNSRSSRSSPMGRGGGGTSPISVLNDVPQCTAFTPARVRLVAAGLAFPAGRHVSALICHLTDAALQRMDGALLQCALTLAVEVYRSRVGASCLVDPARAGNKAGSSCVQLSRVWIERGSFMTGQAPTANRQPPSINCPQVSYSRGWRFKGAAACLPRACRGLGELVWKRAQIRPGHTFSDSSWADCSWGPKPSHLPPQALLPMLPTDPLSCHLVVAILILIFNTSACQLILHRFLLLLQALLPTLLLGMAAMAVQSFHTKKLGLHRRWSSHLPTHATQVPPPTADPAAHAPHGFLGMAAMAVQSFHTDQAGFTQAREFSPGPGPGPGHTGNGFLTSPTCLHTLLRCLLLLQTLLPMLPTAPLGWLRWLSSLLNDMPQLLPPVVSPAPGLTDRGVGVGGGGSHASAREARDLVVQVHREVKRLVKSMEAAEELKEADIQAVEFLAQLTAHPFSAGAEEQQETNVHVVEFPAQLERSLKEFEVGGKEMLLSLAGNAFRKTTFEQHIKPVLLNPNLAVRFPENASRLWDFIQALSGGSTCLVSNLEAQNYVSKLLDQGLPPPTHPLPLQAGQATVDLILGEESSKALSGGSTCLVSNLEAQNYASKLLDQGLDVDSDLSARPQLQERPSSATNGACQLHHVFCNLANSWLRPASLFRMLDAELSSQQPRAVSDPDAVPGLEHVQQHDQQQWTAVSDPDAVPGPEEQQHDEQQSRAVSEPDAVPGPEEVVEMTIMAACSAQAIAMAALAGGGADDGRSWAHCLLLSSQSAPEHVRSGGGS
eukprot:gene18920-25482_t